MQHGGTYSVPFNVAGGVQIQTTFPAFDIQGVLFFVPDPESSTREYVATIGGFFGSHQIAWTRAGTYELDIYAIGGPSPTFVPWWKRLFTAVVGDYVYAQSPDDLLDTIRFTVVNSDPDPTYAECCSSVLFLPGFEASILKSGSNTLWPPDLIGTDNDLAALRVDDEGNSITENVVVDGIVNLFHGVHIYDGFSAFMDGLAVDGTINEWKPFAYDWRYRPERIIGDGVMTPDGLIELVPEVERLAEESQTGQVIVVAHSNGGLVGKALIQALEDQGKEDLIDSFVMVASPQLGTAQAVGGLLHGERADLGSWYYTLVTKAEARSLAENMESAYTLLPSREYFNYVTDPTVVFSEDAAYTDSWRALWGQAVGNFTELFEFLTDTGDTRSDPAANNTRSPVTLNSDILGRADEFHSFYDTDPIPSSIRVVQVAGWGLDTIKGIEYLAANAYHAFQPPGEVPYYIPRLTSEGDYTVLYPSALSSEGEKYYFNLTSFNKAFSGKFEHKDILNTSSIQALVHSVVLEETVSLDTYILNSKPSVADISDKLLIAVHSPLTLGASDNLGNFTGVDPANNPAWGIQFVEKEIPNSTYFEYGEGKYLVLPDGDYTFQFAGTGSGAATVVMETIQNDIQTPTAIFSDIPVSSSTEAELVLTSGANPEIVVDSDGNGEVDLIVQPDSSVKTFEELLTELKVLVQGLTVTDKVKTNFLKRIDKLEQKIAKQKVRKSNILQNLEDQVDRKAAKNKIDSVSAGELIALINELETQIATFPLSTDLIINLKTKIESLATTQALKNSLLKKVERLEKLTDISNSLSNFLSVVERKGDKGKLSEVDTQALTDLLNQLENAL